MNILITNDDGVNAIGLKKLVNYSLKYGNVFVVAPSKEQSGASHSVVFRNGYKVYQIDDVVPGVKTWCVESTPADCVRIAAYYLNIDFDVVFSGINAGYNIGRDIAYSGTCAAATEGVLVGKKAIAFSTDKDTFDGVDNNFEKILELIFENKLLDKWNLYNINIPNGAKKIAFTNQGGVHYNSIYNKTKENYVEAEPIVLWSLLDNTGSDIDLVHEKIITITPLLTDRTNYEILKIFK